MPRTDRVEALAEPRQLWRDPKRYWWLLGLSVPTLPFMAWVLVHLTGWGLFWWWGPIFVFVLIPLLDVVVGVDHINPPESQVGRLDRDRWYRVIIYAYLPLQYLGLVWACWQWTYGDLSVADRIGLAMTIGVVGGIAINTAHELGHKRDDLERWLSKVALAQTGYGHFYVEHNHGHHIRVATPQDPASSRMGESFWAFWPRTVIGSFRSAWTIEVARLRRRGLPWWSPRNNIINAWAMTVVLFSVLGAVFGPSVLIYLALQAVFGFSLLEVVNYLEHYGLLRATVGDRYERTTARHSWNASNSTSNIFLYHLQRHSDHHANPTRRYQVLRHVDEAPQLPSGYGAMVLLALCPPWWRKVMDPRVLAHYDGNLELVNMTPAKRAKVLARSSR